MKIEIEISDDELREQGCTEDCEGGAERWQYDRLTAVS